MDPLTRLASSAIYWGGLAAVAVGMEAVALFYQYALGYGPCPLCIHVRIWVAGLALVALAGLLLRGRRPIRLACHVLAVVMSLGMTERAWQTFATERGISDASCTFSAGLPPWFALDAWLPFLFNPTELCGYTPLMPFGVSMAEALLAASVTLVLITLTALVMSVRHTSLTTRTQPH